MAGVSGNRKEYAFRGSQLEFVLDIDGDFAAFNVRIVPVCQGEGKIDMDDTSGVSLSRCQPDAKTNIGEVVIFEAFINTRLQALPTSINNAQPSLTRLSR